MKITLSIIISSLLTIESTPFVGCPRGWYGPSCQLGCPGKCLESTCDPETGRCYRGCQAGYTGDLCNQSKSYQAEYKGNLCNQSKSYLNN